MVSRISYTLAELFPQNVEENYCTDLTVTRSTFAVGGTWILLL